MTFGTLPRSQHSSQEAIRFSADRVDLRAVGEREDRRLWALSGGLTEAPVGLGHSRAGGYRQHAIELPDDRARLRRSPDTASGGEAARLRRAHGERKVDRAYPFGCLPQVRQDVTEGQEADAGDRRVDGGIGELIRFAELESPRPLRCDAGLRTATARAVRSQRVRSDRL